VDRFECERELRRAVLLQVRQPLLCFVDSRRMARRDPPERYEYACELLEPFAPVAEQFSVRGAIDVLLQRVRCFPYR
jgi:hypothetical protein